MKSKWPIVNLGKHTSQQGIRNRDLKDVEVFSVTNSGGFTKSSEYFSKEVFSKDLSNYKLVKKNQFAYNPSRINVGSIACLSEADFALVSPLYIIFEVDKDKLFPDYVLRYLKSHYGNVQIRNNTQGSVRDSLKYEGLERIKIPLPPFNVQVHIASVLTRAEKLIAKRKESISALDEFLKSTFLEMFGDPVRNEKGWEKKTLGELGSLDRGVSKHRPRNAPELLGGIYPLIQTGEVSNSGTYITKFNQTYSEIGFKQSKLWKADTLCITIAANIAKTGILTFDACFPDSVVGFTLDKDETHVLYVHYLFSFFQMILEKNAPQAAQKNINLEILRNLQVPKPPLPLQNKFAAIVEKVEALKVKYNESLVEMEKLYESLSQRAFRGEL